VGGEGIGDLGWGGRGEKERNEMKISRNKQVRGERGRGNILGKQSRAKIF